MKTLFILYYRLDIGGIQTKIIDILNYMHKHHRPVRVVLILREKSPIDRSSEVEDPTVIIRYFSDSHWSKIPFSFPLYVTALFLTYQPKAFLALSFYDALSAIWIKLLFFVKPITVILNEDCSDPDGIYVDLNRNFSFIRHLLFRWFYHRADAICAVNSEIANTLRGIYHIPSSKIVRVYNWFSPTLKVKGTTHKKIYDAIYVGRLERIKRVDFLLSTVQEIASSCPNFRLCIVGTGSEEPALKMYVKTNGLSPYVRFIGFSHTPRIYIARSKIFVLASENEGASLAMIEAMAIGIPVVCSSNRAARDVVRSGYSGYIFASRNEYIRHMKKLLSNTPMRLKMGDNAHHVAVGQFGPSNIESYMRLLGV